MSTMSIRMPTSKTNAGRFTILGIDPGYADMGYGVIEVHGHDLKYITCDSIKTKKSESMAARLCTIDKAMQKLIKEHKPQLMVIEKIFFAANQKTAIDVAQARGIMMMEAAAHHVPILEFTPLQIKQALTSNGTAAKSQVAQMVKIILKEKVLPDQDDALDALAIAICGAFQSKFKIQNVK
jgi:crossover junction endodeoxyribonuclease RuvC